MSIVESCTPAFDEQTRQRGQGYFHDGRVELERCEQTTCDATVEGSAGVVYTVELTWDDSERLITARCECTRFEQNELCKHIWAVVLAADLEQWIPDAVVAQNARCVHAELAESDSSTSESTSDESRSEGQLGVNGSEDSAEDDDEAEAEIATPAWPIGGSSRVRKSKLPWDKRLSSLGKPSPGTPTLRRRRTPVDVESPLREAWFELDVEASTLAEALVVLYLHRPELKRGGRGKLRRQSVGRNDLSLYPDPDDQRLLSLLLGHPPEERSIGVGWNYDFDPRHRTCHVAPVLYPILLPDLCATGRFVTLPSDDPAGFADPKVVTWDPGTSWQFRVDAAEVPDESCWQLSAKLVRGDEARSVSEARLLLDSGLALFENTLAEV
nr:SWIM zinc finger family protein [Gammaproteobacteria bacterium]